MIRLLSLFSLLSAPYLTNAQRTHAFQYTIGFYEVNNVFAAKTATDDIRNIFKTFPAYNDSTNRFEFSSPMNIEAQAFDSLMQLKNYHTSFFRKQNANGIKEE